MNFFKIVTDVNNWEFFFSPTHLTSETIGEDAGILLPDI